MSRFENNIMGLVPKQDWLDIPFVVNRPDANPVDTLIGDVFTENIFAYWQNIAAEYQVPLMAQFHAFDTEAQKTFRVPVDTQNIEKGLIKVKIDQSERMRVLKRNGVQNDEMYDYVINDGIRLAEQVITRTKVAKNELMATGQVTIKENDLDLTVDYGVPAGQKGLFIDFGAGASKPVDEQLEEMVQNARDAGVVLNGFMTSRAMMTKLRKNASLQKAIQGSTNDSLIANAALKAYLTEELGLTNIVINDATYGLPDGVDANNRPKVKVVRYFPETGITFFGTPNGGSKLGDGLWGDPPEADSDEIAKATAETSERSPYVYIDQWFEKDPKVLWTKASTLFMPVLYNPNSLFIANAKATPGA